MSNLDDLHRRLEAIRNSGIEERAHAALARLRAETTETNTYIAALEAENARMRELLGKTVATTTWYEMVVPEANPEMMPKAWCRGCGVELWPHHANHRAECPVLEVRSILASDSDGGTTNEPPA